MTTNMVTGNPDPDPDVAEWWDLLRAAYPDIGLPTAEHVVSLSTESRPDGLWLEVECANRGELAPECIGYTVRYLIRWGRR